MADMQQELAPQEVGASEGLEESGTQEVAQQNEEQVAEQEAIPVEDFRKWQSTMDKKLSEYEKKIQELQASLQPEEPTIDETKRYNELLSQYEQLQRVVDDPKVDEQERMQALFAQGALARDLMDAESIIVAREVGINPRDPRYRDAILTGDIRDRRDLERIAWQLKANGVVGPAPDKKKPKSKDADFEARVQEEVKRQIAALRQELGLNNVPGVGSVKTDPKTKLMQQYEEAKRAGDWDTIVWLKRQLSRQ